MARPRSTPSALLTAAQIAELAKVSLRTVRRWIDAGDLRAAKMGRAVRVATADYEQFIRARKTR